MLEAEYTYLRNSTHLVSVELLGQFLDSLDIIFSSGYHQSIYALIHINRHSRTHRSTSIAV